MKNLELKSFRIFLILLIIAGISYLFSSVFFRVTNSNGNLYIPQGQSFITFENNEFEDINFNLSGDANWSISPSSSNTGQFSIKSGEIDDSQNSTVSIDLNIMNSGYVSFWYRVDAEYSTSGNEFYDGLIFYINGNPQEQFQTNTNGSSPWIEYELFVESGTYNFSWSFIKDEADGSTASDNDCAWIDDISFPLSEPLFYNYYTEPPHQDLTSGLFNAFVHDLNDDYEYMKAKGGTFADFDLDGDMDLYYGYTSGHYFENIGHSFIERTQTNSINNSGSRGVVVGDLDNNGYPDILKWRYYFDNDFSHIALLNKGNNRFERINYLDSNELIYLHSQGLLDVDLDGDLDIVAIEKEGDTQFYCYKNNGYDDSDNIQFVNSYSYSRLDDSSSSRTLAIVDFDNDGDQDVYIPRKLDKNWLFVNQTLTKSGDEIIYNSNPEELFIESSELFGLDDASSDINGSTGYGAAWADYDNDDDFDLYLTNWGKNRLYQNNENNFINIAEDLNLESDSLSNGAGWGDFNNDGYIDIWSNNFKREDDLFLNPNGQSRQDWDNSFNANYLSATQDVVPVDYNNDGWLDMFTPGLLMAFDVGVQDVPGYKYTSLLYKNIANDSLGFTNNWVSISLEGAKISLENDETWTSQSNHSAIGARVIVHLSDKNISREVIAGKGHGSMDPLRLHFGIGNNTTINGITVKWPSMDISTNQPKINYYEGPFETNLLYKIVEDIGFVGPKGDVNNDSFTNIIDIVDIVYTILDQNNISETYLWAGDFDFSKSLNVLDITMLINFIFLD
tara:strand:+ start:594 stop:2957 length:2364 start_codon:yes stop_codon:yes gene_type:complete